MTPLWLALALPAAELAVAVHLFRKVAYTRYRALLTYLAVEVLCHFVGAFEYSMATRWLQPIRMGLRAWVVIEVFRFACLRFGKWERARLIGETITISGTCAWLVAMWTRLTPLENFFIFRGYYHIVLAVALWWLQLWWVRKQWLAENQDHRAYRHGLTTWLTNVAVAGTFVKGGAGYWIFPFTDATWWWAGVVSYVLLIANVLWLGRSMTANISCLRPEVAYHNRPGWMGRLPFIT